MGKVKRVQLANILLSCYGYLHSCAMLKIIHKALVKLGELYKLKKFFKQS